MKNYKKKSLGGGHYIYSADFREATEYQRSGAETLGWILFFAVTGLFALYFISWLFIIG